MLWFDKKSITNVFFKNYYFLNYNSKFFIYSFIENITILTQCGRSPYFMYVFDWVNYVWLLFSEEMTLNLINRVEHQRKEIPPISGILKRHYRGKKKIQFHEKKIRDFNFMNNFFREIVIFLDFFFVVMTLLTMFPVIKIVV